MATTTTTTVALGANGAGFAAAAVGGAALLGLLGIAALASSGGGDDKKKKHYGYHKHSSRHGGGGGGGGHGGGGGGGGHGGGGGYGHGRHGRHARSLGESFSLKLMRMMELIKREDVTECGLKLMCELGRDNPEDLTPEELSILTLVGPDVVPGEDLRGLGALGEYRQAKGLGQTNGNCAEAYVMCPFNGRQLMEAVMEFIP